MWIIFVVAGAFFAAILAIGYFGLQEGADRLLEPGPAREEIAAGADRCGECSAPLRREATRDQIVFEIEHRIHADLRDVNHALRASPELDGTARA